MTKTKDLEKRHQIQQLLKEKKGVREIARLLHTAPMIVEEVKRHMQMQEERIKNSLDYKIQEILQHATHPLVKEWIQAKATPSLTFSLHEYIKKKEIEELEPIIGPIKAQFNQKYAVFGEIEGLINRPLDDSSMYPRTEAEQKQYEQQIQEREARLLAKLKMLVNLPTNQ